MNPTGPLRSLTLKIFAVAVLVCSVGSAREAMAAKASDLTLTVQFHDEPPVKLTSPRPGSVSLDRPEGTYIFSVRPLAIHPKTVIVNMYGLHRSKQESAVGTTFVIKSLDRFTTKIGAPPHLTPTDPSVTISINFIDHSVALTEQNDKKSRSQIDAGTVSGKEGQKVTDKMREIMKQMDKSSIPTGSPRKQKKSSSEVEHPKLAEIGDVPEKCCCQPFGSDTLCVEGLSSYCLTAHRTTTVKCIGLPDPFPKPRKPSVQ